MNEDENQQGKLPVKGHDFARHEEEGQKKKSALKSKAASQKDGNFSELEKSRMENPPDHREENGSDKDDVNSDTRINQSKGIK